MEFDFNRAMGSLESELGKGLGGIKRPRTLCDVKIFSWVRIVNIYLLIDRILVCSSELPYSCHPPASAS